jgi:probable HAF family extracellular repeat protein
VQTSPSGISNSGEIVGSYYDPKVGIGFGFTDIGGVFTTLSVPGALFTQVNAINGSGQLIVGAYTDANFVGHGFFDAGGSFFTLDDPNGIPGATQATGVNDSGDIVGFYEDASGQTHGYLYSGGVFTPLDDPAASGTGPFGIPNGTNPLGINDAGQIVGTYDLGAYGFIYSGGSFTTVTDSNPNGPSAQAIIPHGINSTGLIIGQGFLSSLGKDGPFVGTNGNFSALNVPNILGGGAQGINDSGQIVGLYAGSGASYNGGFLATPTPEPGTLPLLGAGLLGIALVARRKTARQ